MSVAFSMRGMLVQLTPPIRILVVDDFEPYRRFICSMIQQRPDLTVLAEVQDGLEAVRQAGLLQPDLILLDLHMPHLTGTKVIEQLRDLISDSYLPVLVLTADITPEAKRQALPCLRE